MMYGESTWYKDAEKRVKEVIAKHGISGEQADEMFSDIEDIMSDVHYEGKQDGAFEESYHHVCNPDW